MSKERELVKCECKRCGAEFFVPNRIYVANAERIFCSAYCRSFFEKFGAEGIPLRVKGLSMLETDPNRVGSIAWWRSEEAKRRKKQDTERSRYVTGASRDVLV
jgi:hypothetical protein